MKPPFFELENASVYREGRKVFDRLSLSLETGTHTAVLGPNGSGKSTLLKLIHRELYPAAIPGSLMRTFGKERINAWELRKRIGMVSADLQHLYLERSFGRNVVLSGFYSSIDTGGTQEFTDLHYRKADELLRKVGAADFAERRFGSLSTGEQRRLLLARALVHDPDILLLDEPTAGLDLNARFDFFDTLGSFLDKGKTVLLITHHIEEIPPGIERVVLMKNCAVHADGAKDEVLTDKNLSAIFERKLEIIQRDGFRYVLPG